MRAGQQMIRTDGSGRSPAPDANVSDRAPIKLQVAFRLNFSRQAERH
jgi:hypothetical protein